MRASSASPSNPVVSSALMEAEGKQTAKYRENIDCAAAAGTILAGRSGKAASSSRQTLMNFGLLLHPLPPAAAPSNLIQGSARTKFCLEPCLEFRLCTF